MLTARGWWLFFISVALTLAGILRTDNLALLGLGLLLWFGWEWLCFGIRARLTLRRLQLQRTVEDDRGPISVFWMGKSYQVRVRIFFSEPSQDGGSFRLPYVLVSDPIPFAIEHTRGSTTAEGSVDTEKSLELTYRIHCPGIGVARFEGVRVEFLDVQGLFYHDFFLRNLVQLPILPPVLAGGHVSGAWNKRLNRLMPPGRHRLRQPGSSSELLDLRDYQPGDSPRTIAWKVSARRDRLITKDFESEVPARCTLFLDASRSVRLPRASAASDSSGSAAKISKRVKQPMTPNSRYRRSLDQLVELASGVLEASTAARDKVALCVFEETGSRTIAPARTGSCLLELQRELARVAASAMVVAPSVDPEPLIPIAYTLAEDIYPECLKSRVNSMPLWLTWLVAFPRYPLTWRGVLEFLHRHKRSILFLGTSLIPLLLLVVNLTLLLSDVSAGTKTLFWQLSLRLSPIVFVLAWLTFLFSLLVSGRYRRLARQRKRLAALLSVRQGLAPGGLEALLQQDELFSTSLQQFLAEHAVPFELPLYDNQGNYLGADVAKIPVLASALINAVRRARDNELYVLLVDLLEVDQQLDPLLSALRLARSRHHQVLVICPWPPGVPAPQNNTSTDTLDLGSLQRTSLLAQMSATDAVRLLTRQRLHSAYTRLLRKLAGLGVTLTYAVEQESIPLILERMDQLRKGVR